MQAAGESVEVVLVGHRTAAQSRADALTWLRQTSEPSEEDLLPQLQLGQQNVQTPAAVLIEALKQAVDVGVSEAEIKGAKAKLKRIELLNRAFTKLDASLLPEYHETEEAALEEALALGREAAAQKSMVAPSLSAKLDAGGRKLKEMIDQRRCKADAMLTALMDLSVDGALIKPLEIAIGQGQGVLEPVRLTEAEGKLGNCKQLAAAEARVGALLATLERSPLEQLHAAINEGEACGAAEGTVAEWRAIESRHSELTAAKQGLALALSAFEGACLATAKGRGPSREADFSLMEAKIAKAAEVGLPAPLVHHARQVVRIASVQYNLSARLATASAASFAQIDTVELSKALELATKAPIALDDLREATDLLMNVTRFQNASSRIRQILDEWSLKTMSPTPGASHRHNSLEREKIIGELEAALDELRRADKAHIVFELTSEAEAALLAARRFHNAVSDVEEVLLEPLEFVDPAKLRKRIEAAAVAGLHGELFLEAEKTLKHVIRQRLLAEQISHQLKGPTLDVDIGLLRRALAISCDAEGVPLNGTGVEEEAAGFRLAQ